MVAGSDLYTGTLELLVLKALSWGPMHGYAINKWIQERTGDAVIVAEGSLYPALHRLERRGLLHEEWGVTDRNREAKYYSLTTAGRTHLRAETARFTAHANTVAAVLALRRA
jgi:transcriptional regulator